MSIHSSMLIIDKWIIQMSKNILLSVEIDTNLEQIELEVNSRIVIV